MEKLHMNLVFTLAKYGKIHENGSLQCKSFRVDVVVVSHGCCT